MMMSLGIGDTAPVRDLLCGADQASPELGGAANHYWTSFGPTNVQLHRCATAVELGDGRTAVDTHEKLDMVGFSAMLPERRAHHFPDIARFVREVARVLTPGGLFLLIDCVAPSNPELDAWDNRVEKWRDPSHGRSCTVEEWREFFVEAGLTVEHLEFFRKSHEYDDWTARAHLPLDEKEQLARFILESDKHIQRYFDVRRKVDGQLESFVNDFILLKGRKA